MLAYVSFTIFTELHTICRAVLARMKPFVRPSVSTQYVCLSDKRVNCDKTKETSGKILTPQKVQTFQFCYKKNGWWGDPLYL